MQVKGKGRGNDAPPLSYSFALIPRDAMYRSRRGMANTSQTMAVDKPILPFRASSHALAVTSLWGRSVESIVMFILYSIQTRKCTFARATSLQIPRFPFSTRCACQAVGMALIEWGNCASVFRRCSSRPLRAGDPR